MKPFRALVIFSFIYSTYANYAKLIFCLRQIFIFLKEKKRNIAKMMLTSLNIFV